MGGLGTDETVATLSTATRPSLTSVNLDATYTYDNEGRVTATQYPSTWNGSAWVAGPHLSNTYDIMGRLQKLTDVPTTTDIISSATYESLGRTRPS